jgi:hypothetical protein
MRSHHLPTDVGQAVRVGIVVLGLAGLATFGVIILSTPGAYALDGGGDKGGGVSAGAKGGKANASVGTGTGLGIFGILFGGGTGGTPRTNGGRTGETAFGMDTSDVRTSFESLTPPQRARVMQRCKTAIASPARADPNQLALCQTLMSMAKR